jgi:hypothetical protein
MIVWREYINGQAVWHECQHPAELYERVEIGASGEKPTRPVIVNFLNQLEAERDRQSTHNPGGSRGGAKRYLGNPRGGGSAVARGNKTKGAQNATAHSGPGVSTLQVRSRSSGYIPAHQSFPFNRE